MKEEQVEELKQNFFESRGTNSTKGKFGEDVLSNQSIKNKQKLSDTEINN